MTTQIVKTTPVPPSSSTSLATRPASMPTAIVGLRSEGGGGRPVVIVLIEAGGKEHRCASSPELWKIVHELCQAKPDVVVQAEPESLKSKRKALFEAFSVLGGKGREKLAERVGEDTVGAVETIARTAGGSAVGYLQRTAVRGSSSLGRRAAREARRPK